jgi:hypothetical protein
MNNKYLFMTDVKSPLFFSWFYMCHHRVCSQLAWHSVTLRITYVTEITGQFIVTLSTEIAWQVPLKDPQTRFSNLKLLTKQVQTVQIANHSIKSCSSNLRWLRDGMTVSCYHILCSLNEIYSSQSVNAL